MFINISPFGDSMVLELTVTYYMHDLRVYFTIGGEGELEDTLQI